MKRIVVLLLLCVACQRESPVLNAPPPKQPAPAPPRATTIAGAPARMCDGDGSYQSAVDCFRSTRGFHFAFAEGKGRAEGELTRPTPGAERVRFTLAGNGTWTAERGARGVVWTHDGKHVLDEPRIADDIFQRTALFLDPEKTAPPQLVETGHWRFTDKNTGETYDVWIDAAEGNIAKLTTSAPLTMTVSHFGE